MVFRLITEGPTDQVVLRHLLAKYFSDPDIDTRPVQPNTDSTDEADRLGGWTRVLNYCNSPDMANVLEADGKVIIQMDTDVCEEYGVAASEGGRQLPEDEIIEKTVAVIIRHIGNELYSRHGQKIIFAISHTSIECWLLPLYYNDNRRAKTVSCCDTLNQVLIKEGFTIDCDNKKGNYYYKICKKIGNKRHIEDICRHNKSFSQFIQYLSPLLQEKIQ